MATNILFTTNQTMKQVIIVSALTLTTSLSASAQTFTGQLQQRQPGQGVVTIVEDKHIDSLVNGQTVITPAHPATTNKPAATSPEHKNAAQPSANSQAQNDSSANRHEENAVRREESRPETTHTESNTESENAAVDTRKKVMRGGRKVTGYRVQVFAGGNSRADRQKAEQAGNAIKAKYPTQPVYVHFFSPRWICRVGNYTSLDQAQWMLKQVRAMGYKSATIVKGQITVQN